MKLTNNLFQNVVGATALFVAAVAAFFSVAGIGMLFSGAAISAMVMASALECGKVVATSFLYRYWDKTSKFLKTYLIGAILTLIVITSLGVFGWLSSAYQSSASQFAGIQQQQTVLVEQKKSITIQIQESNARVTSLSQIRDSQEKRMNDTLNNTSLARNPTQLKQLQDQNMALIKQTNDEILSERQKHDRLYSDSSDIDRKILELSTRSSATKDVATFNFVADAIGWDLNKTVKWFIVVIIAVFDPLAVCLILAYNVIAYGSMKRSIEPSQISTTISPPTIENVSVSEPMNTEDVSETPPTASESTQSFMPPSVTPIVPTNVEATKLKSITPPAKTEHKQGNLREYEYFHSPPASPGQ